MNKWLFYLTLPCFGLASLLIASDKVGLTPSAQAQGSPTCSAAMDFVQKQAAAGVNIASYTMDELRWAVKYGDSIAGCTNVPAALRRRMSGDVPVSDHHSRMNCHIAFDYVLGEVDRKDLSQVSKQETDWAQEYLNDVENGRLCSDPPRSLVIRATGHMISKPTTKQALAKAMDSGDGDAALEIAMAYFHGTLVAKDANKGYSYLHAASKLGTAWADVEIAEMFKQNKVEGGDAKTGFSHALKAAEAGQPQAMLMVATAYDTGWGTPKSKTSAFSWYKKAVSNGYFALVPLVAERMFTGEGTTKDRKAALNLARVGADAGDANSMALIPSMMLRQTDFRANEGEVWHWLNNARNAGNRAAIDMYAQNGDRLKELFKPVPYTPPAASCPETMVCEAYYTQGGRAKARLCYPRRDPITCDYSAR